MINSDFEKRRIAIYARVSTEHEAQLAALGNQIDWYKPILEARPNWTLTEQYIEEGITGTSAEKRPVFLRMIEDAKRGKFDMIITREVSRFARNTVDTLQYTRMLKEYRVEVFFINDNIRTFDSDGELRLTIMATLAQDESRKTSIRVKSGQQTSMNNGVIYGNGNILGYTRYEWKEGDKKCVEMRINPEQAKTVRLIYDMYLEGHGLARIRDELERNGYLTSTGKARWFPTVISHVLKNSFYCGIITYHKQYTPDYLKQKKINNYGDIDYTIVQGTHEPIVTVEEYERVQKIMASKRGTLKNLNTGRECKGKKPRTTIWGKLLVCECGHNFNMRVWDRKNGKTNSAYQCYSSVHTGSYESRKKRGLPLDDICQTPMIPEWKLQMMANYIFSRFLKNKEKVLEIANSMLEAHICDTEELEDRTTILSQKSEALEKLNLKLDRYIEMRAEGDISKEIFRLKSSELEAQITKLQQDISALQEVQKEQTEIVDYKERITVLRYALEQYTNFREGEDIPESVIEAFVVKIVASKDGFDWYLRFDGDDSPLHCTTKGKRKSTTQISVAGVNSPAIHTCHTGCY